MSDVTPPPAATPYAGSATGPKTNTLSIVALVLSILWISIPAVICGHIGLNQIKSRGEGGRGIAIAGLVIGYIGIVGGLITAIVWALFFAAVASNGGSFAP